MIAPPQFDFRDDCGSIKLIKNLIKSRYEVPILASYVLNWPTIDVLAKVPFFFGTN